MISVLATTDHHNATLRCDAFNPLLPDVRVHESLNIIIHCEYIYILNVKTKLSHFLPIFKSRNHRRSSITHQHQSSICKVNIFGKCCFPILHWQKLLFVFNKPIYRHHSSLFYFILCFLVSWGRPLQCIHSWGTLSKIHNHLTMKLKFKISA